MINFEFGTMRIDQDKYSKIKEWAVWFRTMQGLFTTLEEAVENAKQIDMPLEMVRPVTVAIAENGQYEEVFR